MLAYAILGIALLAGILLILRWFVTAQPRTLIRMGMWIALAGVSLVAVLLAATGRLQWLLATAMALLPWLMPLIRARQRSAGGFRDAASGSGSGRTSDVHTRFLRMSLDHDSGELDGVILEGPLAGSRLGDTSLTDLFDLLSLCRRNDPQSAQVLEAYLDRAYPDWRAGTDDPASGTEQESKRESGRGEGMMTPDEAYEILGLEPGASESDIKRAHHRLIGSLHPDRGGTNYLAAKINQARQVLLGR